MKWRDLKKYIGKIIMVTFDDHATGKGLVRCRAIGELREASRERLILCQWVVLDEDRDVTERNEEYFTVAIGAIRDIRIAIRWKNAI
jgi:hypothetical protein